MRLTLSEAIEDSEEGEDDDEDAHQLIIFAISGLSGISSGSRYMPFVNKLSSAHGVRTTKARTVSSTHSLPGWIGHFYAATPSEYGCIDDSCSLPPEQSNYHSILDVLQYDYNYAISIHSNECSQINNENIIEKVFKNKYPVSCHPLWEDRDSFIKIASSEENLPQTNKRVIIFHFSGLDIIGQSMGYGSYNYRSHITCIDQQIKQITEKLWKWDEENSTFLLISNHGGHKYNYNKFNLDSIQVPIAMWGYGIKEKVNLFTKSIDTTQVAPSILNCLEYDIPEEWNHKPISNINIEYDENDIEEDDDVNLRFTEEKQGFSDPLISFTYYDYKNLTHPTYSSSSFCIIPFTSSHKHILTTEVIFSIVLILSLTSFSAIFYFIKKKIFLFYLLQKIKKSKM